MWSTRTKRGSILTYNQDRHVTFIQYVQNPFLSPQEWVYIIQLKVLDIEKCEFYMKVK